MMQSSAICKTSLKNNNKINELIQFDEKFEN